MRHHKKTPDEIETEPVVRPAATSPLRDIRLPPYSGSKGVCNRCGQDNPSTIYFPAGSSCRHVFGGGWRASWGSERLHRTCSCGFTWDEACVTPAPPDPAPTLFDIPAIKDE